MAENQIFLSYSLADSDTARHVVRAIEERGWPISWERYEAPDAIASMALREALGAASCVVVLWSRNAIDAQDVLEEATLARSKGILVQAALDDAPIPVPFLLDEPTRLTDKWSIGTLVRQVSRVLDGEMAFAAEAETPEPETLDARMLDDAEAHADAGALHQAIALYERWIAVKPDDMKAVRRLGDLLLAADRESDAAEQYEKVAEHYALSGFLVPAIETYRRIVDLSPDVDAFRSRLEELEERRQSEAKEPEVTLAGVEYTLTAPPYVRAGDRVSINVWAHRPEDRYRIPTDAPLEPSDASSVLVARLHLDGLDVDDTEASIHWKDGIGAGSFDVEVPDDATAGGRSGVIAVQFSGLQVARIHFILQVADVTAPRESIPTRQEHHRHAIAVFAPEDRERVLSHIRAFEKAAPGVDVFMDLTELRSREDGLSRFLDLVSGGDVFYLFWSENAARSTDVEREWRYALRLRGVDFIDAIPLDPPAVAPPPEELAMLHGGNWQSAYENASPYQAPRPPEPGLA